MNAFRPTVVIGLGGTGKQIILALKKMIAENAEHGMADFPFLRLLSLDTDVAVTPAKSNIQTVKTEELTLDRNKEVFQLKTNFASVPDLEHDFKNIDDWFPRSQNHLLQPSNISTGAGQKKPVGRFTFAWNANELLTKIQNILSNPIDISTANNRAVGSIDNMPTNVFICGSVCGGTGAGTFIDTAYMVRYVAKNLSGQRTVNVYGIIALASLFEGMQGNISIRENCYASMVEMDYFSNPLNHLNKSRCFYPAYKNFTLGYSNAANQPPFDFPFLFDRTNQGGLSFGNPSEFSEMAARFIYLLTGGEVAEQYKSMDNNVSAHIPQGVVGENNKPVRYRSMGTYSVMFPRRTVLQLCGYRLMKEYLDIMTDNKSEYQYAPEEISRLVEQFMRDNKCNPDGENLLNAFDKFHNNDGMEQPFTEYLENEKGNKQDDDIDKQELMASLRQWKDDIDKAVSRYKIDNATRARDFRAALIDALDHKLEELIDLKIFKDEANKTASDEPRQTRGSLARAEKFLGNFYEIYNDSINKFRKARDLIETEIKTYGDDIETSFEDLEKAIGGLIGSKKKIENAKEETLDAIVRWADARRKELSYGWIMDLLMGIKENGIQKYPGMVAEIESRKKSASKGMASFQELHQAVQKFLDERKLAEANNFCDVVFDYDRDVEGTYKKCMEGENEDMILRAISDELKGKYFGKRYEKLENLPPETVRIDILREAERKFVTFVNDIDIGDLIINSDEHKKRLENGTYYANANVFVGINSGELDRLGLRLEDYKFYAITIPDVYQGKPCEANRKGQLKQLSNRGCPVEEEPEKYSDKPCPLYGRCLKQIILRTAPENIVLIPTYEKAEINIVNTLAGYPLAAVSSVQTCQDAYRNRKSANEQETAKLEHEEERLHMFGPINMPELNEKTEDIDVIEADFRKKLMLSYVFNRLKVQTASIKFITQDDIEFDKVDNPSMDLGKNMDDIMHIFNSSRRVHVAMIDTFNKDIEYMLKDIMETVQSNPDAKERFKKRFEEVFMLIGQDKVSCFSSAKGRKYSDGVDRSDIGLLKQLAKEICDMDLGGASKAKSSILI